MTAYGKKANPLNYAGALSQRPTTYAFTCFTRAERLATLGGMRLSNLLDMPGIALSGSLTFTTNLSPERATERARNYFLAMLEEEKPGAMDRGAMEISWHRNYPSGEYTWGGRFHYFPKGRVSFSAKPGAVIFRYTIQSEASLAFVCVVLSIFIGLMWAWQLGLVTAALFIFIHVAGAFCAHHFMRRFFRTTLEKALAP